MYKKHCPIILHRKHAVVPGFALIDSGNVIGNAINLELLEELGLTDKDVTPVPGLSQVGTAKAGAQLRVVGQLTRPLHLQIGGLAKVYKLDLWSSKVSACLSTSVAPS